ncbi:peptidase M16 [Geothrix rubra]|uniref:Peptidase M16 n=1 Tax=Geothrix rubra TaxID=2927977 RepID=A0ABQ5Q9X7_9BACT|nr:insulinase family protein [Geothrix rubra]GLH71218.1 peptidase M16 [Geothrix rubra]
MRPLAPLLALLVLAPLRGQTPGAAEVQERRLPNGARLLVVERPGLPAFHATLVFRGGRTEEPTNLAGATDLLARALYGHTWPEDVPDGDAATPLEALLKQEEGLQESLRLERLRLKADPSAPSQAAGLEAGLQALQQRVAALQSSEPLSDVYARAGGRQSAAAEADALVADTELPVADLELWARTETRRLARLQLSRFFEARTALIADLRSGQDQGLALLRGAALPGHPYGRNLVDHIPGLEAIRWSDLRAYARRACGPDRLTIVLVGGVGVETALPILTRTLGALPAPEAAEDPVLPGLRSDLGDRRIQAALGGTSRLLVGWRIPARNQPDHLALRMAAQLLDGGRTGRLAVRLVQQKGLATRVAIRMDEPGAREPGLLTIDLWPAEGHSLAELEGALHSELLRFQQEALSPEEWERAEAELDTEQLLAEDTPGRLARALGRAWTESGDWRSFYSEAQRLRTLEPEAVQAAVQTWLQPAHRTTALIEPAFLAGQDPLEAEMAQTLRTLAARRIEDPGQRERLVAEGLRQLRMLPLEERRRTLKLLTAQLPPVAK